jgi:uncharacterized damage-inducible protein DinB
MSRLDDLRLLMRRDLETFRRELEMFPDDASVWETLPGVQNSAGNLARHVCGNLRHYVGCVLGGDDYARDRVGEFSIREGSRKELYAEIAAAIEAVERVLPELDETRLDRTFPEAVGEVEVETGQFLSHLAVHLSFHLGQAGYLRRILQREDHTADAVSVRALAVDGRAGEA